MSKTKSPHGSDPALSDRARGGESPAGERSLSASRGASSRARGVTAEEQEMIASEAGSREESPASQAWTAPRAKISKRRTSFWTFGESSARSAESRPVDEPARRK